MANAADTPQRLLDAAEELFASRGFRAVSLRELTSAAEANLASVNYHFGSKEQLLAAVFARRLGPLNEARLHALNAAEARHAPAAVPVAEIVTAFLRPLFDASEGGVVRPSLLMRLMTRLAEEDPERWSGLLGKLFAPTIIRFDTALARALPELPDDERWYRMTFFVSAAIEALATPQRLSMISRGALPGQLHETFYVRLTSFLLAGLTAPWSLSS